ncbi:DUF992 domain-containing protein [Fulvimarina sp. MAC3]|uniref:DUF992 domain-containing protein n=1 Tax=Fulvimarina sp. MAC3 TaxID=3148887 RepID=UPI0031FD98B7
MRIKTTLAATAASAAVLTFLSIAPASAAVEVGTLGCHGEGSTGYVIGSSEDLVCEFTPAGGDQPTELYGATLDTFGLDVGVTGRTVMTWAVVTVDGATYQPNSLAGTYVGATADASAIVGGGANVLVGGSNDSFSLQPVSVTAQEGINAAVGVSKFTLTAAQPVVTGEETTPVAVESTANGEAVVPK